MSFVNYIIHNLSAFFIFYKFGPLVSLRVILLSNMIYDFLTFLKLYHFSLYILRLLYKVHKYLGLTSFVIFLCPFEEFSSLILIIQQLFYFILWYYFLHPILFDFKWVDYKQQNLDLVVCDILHLLNVSITHLYAWYCWKLWGYFCHIILPFLLFSLIYLF